MSDAEALQLVAAILGTIATIISAVEQRIIKKLKRQGALSADTAVPLGTFKPLARWRLKRLMQKQVIVETAGQYHYNAQAASALRKRRLRVVIPLVVLAVGLVLIAYYAGQ